MVKVWSLLGSFKVIHFENGPQAKTDLTSTFKSQTLPRRNWEIETSTYLFWDKQKLPLITVPSCQKESIFAVLVYVCIYFLTSWTGAGTTWSEPLFTTAPCWLVLCTINWIFEKTSDSTLRLRITSHSDRQKDRHSLWVWVRRFRRSAKSESFSVLKQHSLFFCVNLEDKRI